MFSLKEYKTVDKDRWNKFADTYGTIFHMIEWKDVLEETFGYKNAYYYVADEKDEIVGLLPILIGRNILLKRVGMSTPFANYLDICCKDNEVFVFIIEQVKYLQREKRLNYIEMRLKEQSISEALPLDDHNYTMILPLDGDEEQVLAYSSPRNRNYIRKVNKEKRFAASFNFDNLNDFYRVWRRRQKQLGSPDHGIKLFQKIGEKFPENAVLLTVMESDSLRVLGGMFLIKHKNVLYYPWGGSDIRYDSMHINEFMYWEAIKFGIINGFEFLDFGRSPYNPESGTFKYKKKFGANPVQLKYYKFGLTPGKGSGVDKNRLEPVTRLWSMMPEFITDFAGEKIIKYVMP